MVYRTATGQCDLGSGPFTATSYRQQCTCSHQQVAPWDAPSFHPYACCVEFTVSAARVASVVHVVLSPSLSHSPSPLSHSHSSSFILAFTLAPCRCRVCVCVCVPPPSMCVCSAPPCSLVLLPCFLLALLWTTVTLSWTW